MQPYDTDLMEVFMDQKLAPVQYRLEVYEDSFSNDPSLTIWSATPLMSISAGDYFEPRASES